MFYCHCHNIGLWVANGREGGRDVINIYLDNGQHLERHNGNYLECPAVVL